MNKKIGVVSCMFVLVLAMVSLVSAGIGLKWSEESLIIDEREKYCMTYSVYNPWPENTYAEIGVSDELKEILIDYESEVKLIPSNTKNTESIPVEFCFKVPQVYERDCWIGNFICKQECKEEQRKYNGEVLAKSIGTNSQIGGSGGSTTSVAVSAPLKLRVNCNAHKRDFTIIYVLSALISIIIITIILIKKYRKPKLQRDREKLKKLREQIRREERKK